MDSIIKLTESLSKVLVEEGVVCAEYEDNDHRLKLRRRVDVTVASELRLPWSEEHYDNDEASMEAEEVSIERPGSFHIVQSSYVGIYRAPKTGSLKIGDSINSQQYLGCVESMGICHEVKSKVDGTVAEVLVDDGEAVEYGQAFLVVDPQ